jgi:hypothetical protein
MRWNGHNILAIALGAVAIWLIGFLIYVVLFEKQWMQWSGLTEADILAGPQRMMPWMVAMPILQAIGLSLAIKWRNAAGWMGGAVTGLLMALCFSVAARMYGWVYSSETTELFALDSAHFFVTHAVAGAVIGAWK